MRAGIILLVVLVAYWLTLSGYFDHPILFVTGGLSVLAVVWMCARMQILDEETVPYLHGKTLGYVPWLFTEIVKANMAVVRAVLSPDMEISPTWVKVKMDHETDLGRTIFANSITLTPGTISVDVGEGEILVHALLEDMTDADGFQEMGERVGFSITDPMHGKLLPGKGA
ncbi:MAG: cation:proton antiporter [Acidimicrobiales bacterium]|nr:Na+/H+ antiporter subunit E [Hyphomonadaceae bacterium]RZV39971.1 MAG: cation:proton antiporter [Acidimicrobiales bacterium]